MPDFHLHYSLWSLCMQKWAKVKWLLMSLGWGGVGGHFSNWFPFFPWWTISFQFGVTEESVKPVWFAKASHYPAFSMQKKQMFLLLRPSSCHEFPVTKTMRLSKDKPISLLLSRFRDSGSIRFGLFSWAGNSDLAVEAGVSPAHSLLWGCFHHQLPHPRG